MDYVDRASGQCEEECQYFNQTLINGSIVVVCEQSGNNSNCPFWEYVKDIDANMCVEECPAFSDSGLCVSSCSSGVFISLNGHNICTQSCDLPNGFVSTFLGVS